MLVFELLHVLEFTSERKKMSVIVKDLQTEKIVLYTKGADDALLPKLVSRDKLLKTVEKEAITEQLYEYACKGLRTLVLAKRELAEEEYLLWDEKYQRAITDISKNRL